MRSIHSSLGARLINEKGEVLSFCVDIVDLSSLMKDAEKKNLKVQFVEIADCSDFSPDDAIRMTMKYPDYSFCEWSALDQADFSRIIWKSEMFADYVRERGFQNCDFYCQRILSEEEQERFLNEGKHQLLINDDGLDKIVLPKRNIEAEKAEFINAIEERNSKVKTLDVEDIQFESFADTEKKELGRYWVKYRTIKFFFRGHEYSAVFNMNAQILKPDASSTDLAITTYEENEEFNPNGYQPIEEAFLTEKLILITDQLKAKISNFS